MHTDWGEDKTDCKSSSDFLFFSGNSLINWMSQKQTFMAKSTTEAEYLSASSACSGLEWLICLLKYFGVDEPKPLILCEDNQACTALS